VLFVVAIVLAVFVVPSPWGIVLVVAAAIVEVAETGFWLWLSRRRGVQVGAETLIGARGRAVSAASVRIDGELWQARAESGLAAGEPVRVVGRDGLVLEVERDTAEPEAPRT
jgi:membrane-bound serine protease (ClpP class)